MRVQPLQDFASLLESIAPRDAKLQSVPKPAEVKAQNEQAVAQLQGMLSGVQGAPRRRGRRRA